MASREKKDFIRKMKEGLNAIIKDEENILEPTLDNVIFLNFFLDPKTNYQPFGEEELFKKIHDFFIESEDYKESHKYLTLDDSDIYLICDVDYGNWGIEVTDNIKKRLDDEK